MRRRPDTRPENAPGVDSHPTAPNGGGRPVCPAPLKAVEPAAPLLVSTLGPQASAQTRLEAFLDIFEGDDRVLVVINADPDAMASAAVAKRLLWRRVAQVTVASVNHVKRPDNLQLLETLKFKLECLENLDTAEFSRLVMVDSQPHHSPQTEHLPFDVIIDHHPATPVNREVPAPAHIDLRSDIGATATMMTGYLKAAKIKPNYRLATALFYAIKTDTQNFVRQGQLEDMKAFRWLYPLIHPPLLSDIERAPIAYSSFKNIVAGLSGAVFHKNLAHTFLEKTDHADTLVILADFLLKIKTVNCCLAAGVCRGKLVIVFRAGGRRQDVGRLAAQAFARYGSAGGHKTMARAEIPLANLDPKIRDHPAALHRFILRRLKERGKPGEAETAAR